MGKFNFRAIKSNISSFYSRKDGKAFVNSVLLSALLILFSYGFQYYYVVNYLAKVRHYGCGRKYFDFWSTWNDKPTFNVEELKEENRKRFEQLMEFSKPFEEIVGIKGFIAWDVAESIQLVREAFLCGYIDEKLASQIIADFSSMALNTYSDWTDFALSYVCGGCYFIYENTGNEEEVKKMCDTIVNAVEQLFFSEHNNIWANYAWFKPKNYFNGVRFQMSLA